MTESNINMRYMRSLIHHLDEFVERLKNILTNKISCITKLKFALLRVLLLYYTQLYPTSDISPKSLRPKVGI